MIKKILIGLLVVLALPAFCLAAADSSRAAAVGGDVESVVGIADGSSGYMLEINSNTGAALVANRANAVTSRWGSGLVYTGACRIISIAIEGESAGDFAAIYDAVTATGTAKFDPRISTNTRSDSIYVGGAPFATGIYVDAIDSDVLTTVVYDY